MANRNSNRNEAAFHLPFGLSVRFTLPARQTAPVILLLVLCVPRATFADGPTRVDWTNAAYRVRDERREHSDRPTVQLPQLPDYSVRSDRDTGRALFDWQHATGDWFGVRPRLDDQGIVFDSSLTFDVSRNFRGGVSTNRSISRHLFDLNMTVNTERLWGWSGGTLFLDFQTFNGSTGDQIVGDYQIFSNIDTLPVTQLPQMWIEQRLRDDTVRVKVGLVDANSEFAYTDYGAEFLNSSMGFSPTIFVMPTYPLIPLPVSTCSGIRLMRSLLVSAFMTEPGNGAFPQGLADREH